LVLTYDQLEDRRIGGVIVLFALFCKTSNIHVAVRLFSSWELKQRRRRRRRHRGRRLGNNEFIFSSKIRNCLDLFSAPMALRTCSGYMCKYAMAAFNSEWKIRKISRRRSRSPDYAKLGHFTLLFCRRTGKKFTKIYIARA